MGSKSETGHARNVALFTDLINICKGFGERYKPARNDLKINALTDLATTVEQLQSELNKAIPVSISAVAAKDKEFKKLSKLVTRALSAFKSSAPLPGQFSNAQTIAKEIKGENNKKKTNGNEEEQVPHHSVSRLSMDSRIENLSRLIELLAKSGVYSPNEEELKLETLTAYASTLKSLSEQVVIAERPEFEARTNRNKALYASDTGLVEIGNAVRDYVKSVFGARSPEYKAVLRIKFRKHTE